MAKFLRHRGNGRIFRWTPILANRADMEPCDGPTAQADESEAQEAVDTSPRITVKNKAGEPEEISIAKASRDVIAAYAEEHFSVKLDKRKSRDDLAAQLQELIEEQG